MISFLGQSMSTDFKKKKKNGGISDQAQIILPVLFSVPCFLTKAAVSLCTSRPKGGITVSAVLWSGLKRGRSALPYSVGV